ncbi:ribose 5-phosphate isomerase B [Chitinophagaceae bacterium LB-8]|uniref:Ribose 5-phosphate isomerase B n=1 Tax=Paraflavisolibacter caeni TaxID=2982496 RepID=A0A9X2XZA7_9BACT|nr:ribose 5-phosphate isomerase B [Paraflavisolibacter caeni]MCU7551665.1 ribose 5-phosphate isomerase B [Paraflavisolibacter caeni]
MNIAFDLSKPVVVGADHAGFAYKQTIIDFLEKNNIPYKDFGTNSPDSVDYPDFAHPVASAVNSGEAAVGILVCGSANGVAITANKHQGVRAAITWQDEIAALARQHNNANIICIPARYVSTDDALQMISTFLGTEFEGGRHANRVNKIGCI